MDEDWRNTFWILMQPLRQGHGVWPRFCTNIVILHIKSKVMKSRILWCKNFALEARLGITRGQKVGFWVLFFFFFFFFFDGHTTTAGLGGSVGCASNCRPEGRGFNIPPPPEIGSILSWRVDHEIFFYGHSLPSADSRRAIVSFWQKNVHNTG